MYAMFTGGYTSTATFMYPRAKDILLLQTVSSIFKPKIRNTTLSKLISNI